MVVEYTEQGMKDHAIERKRARQNTDWMRKLVYEQLEARLRDNPQVKQQWPLLQSQVEQGATTPYVAATQIMSLL